MGFIQNSETLSQTRRTAQICIPSDQVLRPNVIYKALDISSGSFPYLWWLFVKFPNRSGNETQHSRKIHYVSPVPSISKFIEING